MLRLHPVDYFQIATTLLFLVLGAALLVRAGLMRIADPLAYLVGGALVALGVHRGRFIVRALRGKGVAR